MPAGGSRPLHQKRTVGASSASKKGKIMQTWAIDSEISESALAHDQVAAACPTVQNARKTTQSATCERGGEQAFTQIARSGEMIEALVCRTI